MKSINVRLCKDGFASIAFTASTCGLGTHLPYGNSRRPRLYALLRHVLALSSNYCGHRVASHLVSHLVRLHHCWFLYITILFSPTLQSAANGFSGLIVHEKIHRYLSSSETMGSAEDSCMVLEYRRSWFSERWICAFSSCHCNNVLFILLVIMVLPTLAAYNWQRFQLDVNRTLIGSHTLPVESNRRRTAPVIGSAGKCLSHTPTLALDKTAMQV